MRRSILLIALVMALCLISISSVQFDIESAKYKRGTDFWVVTIPVTGVTGQYTLNFQNLPSGWSVNGNNLSIPAAVTKFEQNFPIRVNVRVAGQTVLSRTLLFKFSGSGLFLGDYAYDYIYNGGGSGSLSTIGSHGGSIKFSGGLYIQSSQPLSTMLTGGKTLRSEYNALPSNADLDKIIDSADVVLISRTIQQIISSNLNCLAKIGYLADFLGKIESYISIKGFRAEDLQDIINNAQNEISNLENKIKDLNGNIAALNIPALKTQLNAALARLQTAYNEYNSANVDIEPLTIKASSYRTELSNAQAEIDKARYQLQTDQTEVEKLDGFIAELEDKLNKAKLERANYTARIAETKQFITNSLAQVQNIQYQISEIELKISGIIGDKDSLKSKVNDLQRELDLIKQRITINEKRETDLISKITDYKIEISNLQLDLDDGELNKINDMIGILKDQVLSIRAKIDRLDMQCFGEIDINVTNLDSGKDSMITFTPNEFKSYFNGFYGIDAYSNFISSVPSTQTTGNFNLYGYNIFSDAWANAYGKPFQNDVAAAYSGGVVTDYSFLSDFQCSNYNNMISMSGVIQAISGNVITCDDNEGNAYQLNLGACSRVNGVTKNYPKIGSKISWRGVLDYGNKYNVHTASCY